MDTNADTCCLGKNFVIMSYTPRSADVMHTTQHYHLQTSLLCREQLLLIVHRLVQSFGIPLWDNPFDETRHVGIESKKIFIALKAKGTKLLFDSRAPTEQELATCLHTDLTSKVPWNPGTVQLGKVSAAHEDTEDHVDDPRSNEAELRHLDPIMQGMNEWPTVQTAMADGERFLKQMARTGNERFADVPVRPSFVSTERHTKAKLTLYFDYRAPNLDYSKLRSSREDFQAYYRDAKEEMPHNAPKPRGQSVGSTTWVDASHGANKKTRKSHTGYVIFRNRAPILWHSKRQNTVEASTFGSEFIALKACIEAIAHLRFKLRMFGIPLEDEPTHIFCDNESVVTNATKVESTLNKKHNSIAYHYTRWNVAAGVVDVSWTPGMLNLADVFTKRLTLERRGRLYGEWTY
ncbi:unnamed protein product [Cylindrotheca closterium]|uniref:Reverse transcriptase Ty1/copia-type domain-containing protein n=1 Tax=Cylindrotheca closterium TaxID=2856 RepID=A0AAD2JKH3_9STRA|nr:unnamed protein product [Cylindrotheca closterium]